MWGYFGASSYPSAWGPQTHRKDEWIQLDAHLELLVHDPTSREIGVEEMYQAVLLLPAISPFLPSLPLPCRRDASRGSLTHAMR